MTRSNRGLTRVDTLSRRCRKRRAGDTVACKSSAQKVVPKRAMTVANKYAEAQTGDGYPKRATLH